MNRDETTAAADRHVAQSLARDVAELPDQTLVLSARALRDLFGRKRLTDLARQQIDAAIAGAGCRIDPPLTTFDDGLKTEHRIVKPSIKFDRPRRRTPSPVAESPSSGQAPVPSAQRITFERPGRRVASSTDPAASSQPAAPQPVPMPSAGDFGAPGRGRPGRRTAIAGWAAAGVLGIALLSTLGGDEGPAPADRSAAPAAQTVSRVIEEGPADPTQQGDPTAELMAEARDAASRNEFAVAYRLASEAGRRQMAGQYRTKGLSRARRNAERAMAAGDPQRALRIVRQARSGYASTGALAAVAGDARAELSARRARAKAAAEARAAQRARERAERKAAREAAAAAEAAEEAAAAAPSVSDGSQYAGMNCDEIGHSFPVEPGSDPVPDRDNDGVACESQ